MTWESNLRELLEKATPEPWEWVIDGFGYALIVEGAGAIFTPQAFEEGDTKPDPDSALIVALRNDAERLVALVEAARELQAAETALAVANSVHDVWHSEISEAYKRIPLAKEALRVALAALEGGTELNAERREEWEQ